LFCFFAVVSSQVESANTTALSFGGTPDRAASDRVRVSFPFSARLLFVTVLLYRVLLHGRRLLFDRFHPL
jgi:hypothetical protein